MHIRMYYVRTHVTEHVVDRCCYELCRCERIGLNDVVSHLLHSFLGSVSAVLILCIHSSMYGWTKCTYVGVCVCVHVRVCETKLAYIKSLSSSSVLL